MPLDPARPPEPPATAAPALESRRPGPVAAAPTEPAAVEPVPAAPSPESLAAVPAVASAGSTPGAANAQSPASTPADTAFVIPFCFDCGYDLTGNLSGRCPECGRQFDAASLAQTRIPWTERNRIGRFRAFRQTVWQVSFRPHRAAEEVLRPVDYTAANRFRWTVVLVAWASTVLLLAGLWFPGLLLKEPWSREFGPHADRNEPRTALFAAFAVGLLPGIYTLTELPSALVRNRSVPLIRQNRAAALALYCCAPMGLAPVTFGALAAIIVVVNTNQVWFNMPAAAALAYAAVVTAGVLGLLIFGCIQFMSWPVCIGMIVHLAGGCGGRRSVPAALAAPALALGWGIVFLAASVLTVMFTAAALGGAG